jgi:hypothetical protein
VDPITIGMGVMSAAGAIFGGMASKGAGKAAAAAQREAAERARMQRDLELSKMREQRQALWEQAQTHKLNAELLAEETETLEMSWNLNEGQYELDREHLAASGARAKKALVSKIDATAGLQTVGYHKSGVTMSGTPALMVTDTYERGQDDLDALIQAQTAQDQAIITAQAFAEMDANRAMAATSMKKRTQLGLAGAAISSIEFNRTAVPIVSRIGESQAVSHELMASHYETMGRAAMWSGMFNAASSMFSTLGGFNWGGGTTPTYTSYYGSYQGGGGGGGWLHPRGNLYGSYGF